jgi:hypothetical protein
MNHAAAMADYRARAKGRADSETSRTSRATRTQGGLGWLLVPFIAALVGAAWLVVRFTDFRSGSPLGYNLGVAGGVGMLVIFLYPLRKRVRLLRNWGATKGWFALHMMLGIAAPLLILVHSRFQIGSVNAGVALTCMLLVAGSGVVGRFIYVHIHHGLYGTRMTLSELQAESGLNSGELRSKLSFAPRVEQWLRAFEASATARPANFVHGAWRFLTLGLRARWTERRCSREFAHVYRMHARAFGWDTARQQRHLAGGRAFIKRYVAGAQRVAQFSRYERLFSMWHMLHVPLLWMMVFTAVAHVVAVHAY